MTVPMRSLAISAALALALPIAALADEGGASLGSDNSSTKAGERKEMPKIFGDMFGGDDKGKAADHFDASGLVADAMLEQRTKSLGILRSEGQGLVANDALSGYLNGVMARLVAASPFPDTPAKVFVVASSGFGGASYPDGSIFVTLGMLRDLRYEDELAFVLAHELSHVLYRHHGSDWFVNIQNKLFVSAQLLGNVTEQLGEYVDSSVTKDLKKASMVTKAAYEVSDHALNPAWTRGQEEDADRLGIDILIAAGYNTAGVSDFLTKQEQWEERIETARRQAREAEEARIKMESQRITKESNIFMAAVSSAKDAFTLGADSLKSSFDRDHKPATERLEDFDAYVEREYPDIEEPDAKSLPWTGADPTAEIVALFRNYKLADDARAQIGAGKVGAAEQLIRKAIAKPTADHSYMRYVFYELRQRQGKPRLARKNLEIALKAPEVSLPVYEALIVDDIAHNHTDDALATMAQARDHLGDPPGLLPTRIALYAKTGQKKEMQSLVLQCQYEWPALAKACRRAAGITKQQDDQADPKKDLLPAALKGKSG